MLPEIDDLHYEHPLSSVSITSDIVFNKLSALKSDKSPGPDSLNPLILKEAAAQLCIPLSMFFRRLFDEGHLPDDWKRANIVPVFKNVLRNTAWSNNIQQSHAVDVLYFNFKKAFDKVSHERLLIKLKV